MLLITLLVTTLCGLTSSLLLSAPNLGTFVLQLTNSGLKSIFASMKLKDTNFDTVARLLGNDLANLQHPYNSSCNSWSPKRFDKILQWSSLLTDRDRDMLLNPLCVSQLKFSNWARQKLLDLYLPGGIPTLGINTSIDAWHKVLQISSARNIRNWCMVTPYTFLESDYVNDISLATQMSRICLERSYPNKRKVMDRLIEQLPKISDAEMSHLLLTLDGVVNGDLGRLRRAISLILCDNLSQGIRLVNGIFFKCSTLQRRNSHKLMEQTLVGSVIPTSVRILLLRIWIKLQPLDGVLYVLRSAKVTMTDASHKDLIQLISDLLRSRNISILGRYALLENVGLDYEKLLLTIPVGLGEFYQDQLQAMPLSWRLTYYRRWHMRVAFEVVSPENFDNLAEEIFVREYLLGSQITYGMLQAQAKGIVSDSRLYEWDSQHPVFRPRTWTSETSLKPLLYLLIYGLIRHGRLMLQIDLSYCQSLEHSTWYATTTGLRDAKAYMKYFGNNRQQDFSGVDCLTLDEFAHQNQTGLHQAWTSHYEALQEQQKILMNCFRDWSLHFIYSADNYCSFLAGTADRIE